MYINQPICTIGTLWKQSSLVDDDMLVFGFIYMYVDM